MVDVLVLLLLLLMSVFYQSLVDLGWWVPVREIMSFKCVKVTFLWNSEEMEQINDRVIHWMLLNTYLFEEKPALKMIGWWLWVLIIYAVTCLMLFLAAALRIVGDGIQETLVWPRTPVLALLCRMFLEAVASLLGDSLT